MARSGPAPLARNESAEIPAAERLAAYATALRFEDAPERAVALAKYCLIDSIGCVVLGAKFPWSKIVLDEAIASGSGGPCRIPGAPDAKLYPPQAALVLGALAHAFEFDNLRKPSTGVHPGATVALPAFAMAQALGSSGRDLVTAIVAGVEVMFRVGAATLQSPEHIGFHAPGLTGPFGAATACASLMRLTPAQTANAYGIAGSTAGGLLAFAKAGSGGMIKRLHLGRAAEAGVTAARLAQRGYEGPRTVLEGRYGLLEAFCEESDASLLIQNLGQITQMERICFKRYPCHVTAHVPVQLLRGFMSEHGFSGGDILEIMVDASEKVVSHHSEQNPADIMLAQYSVPFCVAMAAYHDLADPAVVNDRTIAEPRVRDLARRVRIAGNAARKGWGAGLRVTLRDRRMFEGALEAWLGCPEMPLSADQLRQKFDRMVQGASARLKDTLFDDLMRLETLSSLDALVLA